ncbi:lef-5 [Cryptophlebia peltastica nucleopolyhedrovirus]|uniref:Lef-5 n=1 Tax=Cryptophlebia peltastica nucleopolyhedrovirus TaxID=2304025 RepID=A0A346RNU6_9ABAC|nr:lef-5 [Cryptophlebia peltastica nucleopolyhedrovirus]AXS67743.1 lef-5 [Cryptophlebia peltastica nucleopolyhedrovirus]
MFKEFRKNQNYEELIQFLNKNFPANVKNKTFDFLNTGHMFHSLYAYVPSINNQQKERKQIRLSEECIKKLFENTKNDIEMYQEIFDLMHQTNSEFECPCELLMKRREEIKAYVGTLEQKVFDTKPVKLKKEQIDAIMSKYSLDWKSILIKKKGNEVTKKGVKKKRKIKKRTIMNDEQIYLKINVENKLGLINGMSLSKCSHEYVVEERQMRAGDEIVSFVKLCRLCGRQKFV